MSTKIVSQIDQNGYFIGAVVADESPLEEGVFHIPGGAIDASPPSINTGERARWVSDRFVMEKIPQKVDKTPKPTPEIIWAYIKTERNRRLAGGFKVKIGSAYKWFDSDSNSRIQFLGLKDKARDLIASSGKISDTLTAAGRPIKWKLMDNSFVEVTAQIALDIIEAAGELDSNVFYVAEAHKVAMEASGDPSSYDFSKNWPESFSLK